MTAALEDEQFGAGDGGGNFFVHGDGADRIFTAAEDEGGAADLAEEGAGVRSVQLCLDLLDEAFPADRFRHGEHGAAQG